MAVDADEGTNSRLTYFLGGAGADHFTIDPDSGEIRVSEAGVDYERVLDTPFVLTVTAMDQDNTTQRLTTTTLNVTVTDANDNQPLFLDAPYSQTIPENTTGPAVILTVMAIDEDVSSNGEIFYSISGETENFEINRESVSENLDNRQWLLLFMSVPSNPL